VYSELTELLNHVGQKTGDVVWFMDEIRLQEPGGPEAILAINPFRAPLRTAKSVLLHNDYLGLLDKLSAAAVTAPGVLPLERLRALYDETTVAAWWQKVSGNETLRERFLRPFCRAIQFTDLEDFSAFNFLGWIHHVTRDPLNALLGAYNGPRDTTMFAPIGRWLYAHGATIRTSAKVAEVRYSAGRNGQSEVRGFVLEDGSVAQGDAYVAAVPPWALLPMLPEDLRARPFFDSIGRLPIAPAISVQIWFEGFVVEVPHFTLVSRTHAAVYQDVSQSHLPDDRGSRISVIFSPADDFLDRSDEEIVSIVLADLGRADRGIADARVRKSLVLRHREHLVRPAPMAMSRRPPQATPLPNFFLAGDWTDQPFFGSQEGAVRGGNACARAVLKLLDQRAV
jgi:15-cis-phytoene desaturase